jgi:hypothetical protein
MRVCAAVANGLLTSDECCDLLGGLDVRLRQQMRVRPKDGFGPVAEPGGDHVEWDAVRESERCVGVPQDVQRPGRDAGRLAVAPEPLGEALRMDRPAERIGKDHVVS